MHPRERWTAGSHGLKRMWMLQLDTGSTVGSDVDIDNLASDEAVLVITVLS